VAPPHRRRFLPRKPPCLIGDTRNATFDATTHGHLQPRRHNVPRSQSGAKSLERGSSGASVFLRMTVIIWNNSTGFQRSAVTQS